MDERECQERRCWTAFAVFAALFIVACAPVPDPSATLTPTESIALIHQAKASNVALEAMAETFALGTQATEVQRENLVAEVVGRRVTWDIPIYEVSLNDGRYSVTSQPIPIQDVQAVPLIRVIAGVFPQNRNDVELIEQMKTDDVIRVTGIVQEIRLRTIVSLVPAVVVWESQPKQAL